jgi:aryl sulfotransferase
MRSDTEGSREPRLDWPRKTREVICPNRDSTIWNSFAFREGDIVIANWGKSGCTWLQQIVCQLVFDGREDVMVRDISPWVEFPLPSPRETLRFLDAQTHRRVVKTHLPVDALVYSPSAKYLYVGRDGRDIVWSLFHHMKSLSSRWYQVMNEKRGAHGPIPTGPPTNFQEFFNEWLDRDGYPWWPFWENVRSWWAVRHLPNCMLLHYSELNRDLPGCASRLASFLEIEVDADSWPRIIEHSTFHYMKKRAAGIIRGDPRMFEQGAGHFFREGRNGRWQGELSERDLCRYASRQRSELSDACGRWLESGLDDLRKAR